MEDAINKIGPAGNKGKGVRSDCFVSFQQTKKGGIDIQLVSKVNIMYGASIRLQIQEMLTFHLLIEV